jgi:Subtilase family/Secretion system C-terminal sorting domain
MSKKTFVILFYMCISAPFCLMGQQRANTNLSGFIPNQLIVQIHKNSDINDFVKAMNTDFATNQISGNSTIFKTENPILKIENTAPELGFYLLSFQNTSVFEYYLAKAKTHKSVITTQRNQYLELRSQPNDTDYEIQWNLKKIEAESAWERTKGGTTALGDTIVVAILDGGYQISHEDLQQNIWKNRKEIPKNGIDDDQNGFVDDYKGWDFVFNDDSISRYTGHGTQVAGIIGADGNNNKGVSGVNQQVKMMLLANIETVDNVLRAYNYILKMRRRYNQTNGREGAYIVATNASLGASNRSANDFPLWCAIYDSLGTAGVLSVAATANDNRANTDIAPDMPTDCGSQYLIIVTNTDFEDKLQGAYGKQKVDLAAPGENAHTVYPDPNSDTTYAGFGGTSGATPHVAGAVALLCAMPDTLFARQQRTQPAATALWLKAALLRGVDKLPDLRAKTVSGGRLNLGYSMDILQKWFTPDVTDFLSYVYPNPFQNEVNLQFLTKKTPIAITVFDATGRTILQENYTFSTPSDGILTLTTNNWANGTYLLQARFEDGSYNIKKLIKL